MPTICVYIPTHNRSVMLQRALTSVFNQSLPASEVIVVDDASADDTQAVLADWQKRYPELKVIQHTQPQGACAARNAAIQAATATFITGLDDDDEFALNHLQQLYNAFLPSYAFVSASLIEDTGAGRIVRATTTGEHDLNSLLHYNKFTNQVFTLTSRLKAVQGFDPAFPAMQDYDTWVRLVAQFGAALKIPAATYIWHTGHEQNRISHSSEKRLRALVLFLEKHQALLMPQHKKSLELMRIKMAGESLGFLRCIRLINKGNWRAALALLLNTRLKRIKAVMNKRRLT
ncbi:glycosyl transferase family 2 [Alishewanella longhuensis]|uniref:Glycosyl transferase family 2 n=1 Tax=Alishewanella longhuensis TaxID=1091037 RepID=A0ABQ3KZR6_9ALTE|nr:glycosyltransferase [Alishewanella longhuensis]GHG68020.1 glycosyl transferase family 2 [Alishewanella longhuensis]